MDSITTTYKNEATGGTVVTTTSFSSVECYRNIAVKGDDGKRYTISDLNFFKNVDSAGEELTDPKLDIYTDYKGDKGNSLKDDFAKYFKEQNPGCSVSIEGVTWDGTNTFTVTYKTKDAKTGVETDHTADFELYKDTNEYGAEMATQKKLDDYLYTKTMTTRTEYTIGSNQPDDCLKIDVTGMGPMIVQVGANAGQ